MTSTCRDELSSVKSAVLARKTDEFVDEELAIRNICNRKHGCSVLLSVPDLFTAQICEQTVNFLSGQDLYIPSEIEHAKWYLEVRFGFFRCVHRYFSKIYSYITSAGHCSLHVEA
jgi:hypothetical protein